MKIAFISSCLEPGKDGVGDYTALLARECTSRGHVTTMLALNDRHIDSANADASSLQLPSSLAWPARVEKAKKFLSAFEPDFVSLQFVCYGFHPRGIDFALASRLREIIGTRRVQIMFHELWIGAGRGASLKDRFTGALQRACVLKILRNLNVRMVHTSNAPYAELLRRRNIAASVLPLFGAIPVSPTQIPARGRGDTLVFGIFGALHPEWTPEPLFSLLRKTGKKIAIVHLGRPGAGDMLWGKMERDYAGDIAFKKSGELPPEKIAACFRDGIDFGIATTPWELIGKSASVAAMLEHGLPVIVSRDDWHLDGATDGRPVSPLLIKMDDSLPEKLSTARRGTPKSKLPEVATQFLAHLERAV